MEVASGEYGDQMVRLVNAVQDRKCEKDHQTELNGDTNLHPFLWQRAEEVKNKHTSHHCPDSWNILHTVTVNGNIIKRVKHLWFLVLLLIFIYSLNYFNITQKISLQKLSEALTEDLLHFFLSIFSYFIVSLSLTWCLVYWQLLMFTDDFSQLLVGL